MGAAKAHLQPWSLSKVIHVMIQLAMVIITIAFVYQHLTMNVSPISLKYVPKNRTHIAIGTKQLGWRPGGRPLALPVLFFLVPSARLV